MHRTPHLHQIARQELHPCLALICVPPGKQPHSIKCTRRWHTGSQRLTTDAKLNDFERLRGPRSYSIFGSEHCTGTFCVVRLRCAAAEACEKRCRAPTGRLAKTAFAAAPTQQVINTTNAIESQQPENQCLRWQGAQPVAQASEQGTAWWACRRRGVQDGLSPARCVHRPHVCLQRGRQAFAQAVRLHCVAEYRALGANVPHCTSVGADKGGACAAPIYTRILDIFVTF